MGTHGGRAFAFLWLAASCAGAEREPETQPGTEPETSYSAVIARPDAVTLLGVGSGRSLTFAGIDQGGVLRMIPTERVELRSASSAIGVAEGGRVVGRSPGDGWVMARVDGRTEEVAIAVEVLDGPATFAQSILERGSGRGAGFGEDRLPSVVLGPPLGLGERQGSLDVLSLGIGGSITLGFEPLVVYDGPGPDLIVFENAFLVLGTADTFVEAARVDLFSDAQRWIHLPCDASDTSQVGCAGVRVVNAGPLAPEIDPTDPVRAGGDPFDLSGFADAVLRIRITDVEAGSITGTNSGFDLDAVSLVHALPADVERIEWSETLIEGSEVRIEQSEAVIRMHVGERTLIPRIDAVCSRGTRVRGIPSRLAVESRVEGGAEAGAFAVGSEGIAVAVIEGEILRAQHEGAALLTATAGPWGTSAQIEVTP